MSRRPWLRRRLNSPVLHTQWWGSCCAWCVCVDRVLTACAAFRAFVAFAAASRPSLPPSPSRTCAATG
eukprot:4084695-Prymnesium_polylepis.1